MVSTQHPVFRYLKVNNGELDALLRGDSIGGSVGEDFRQSSPLRVGETGVLVFPGRQSEEPVRPLALVAHNQDIRRLCGRYAQLRTDLSPLTAWCHLLTPDTFGNLDGVAHEPRLRGTDAAWSGLAVAEAMLLTGMPTAKLRVSACLASATYAIGRSKALWKDLSIETIVDRFETANKLCRGRAASQKSQSRALQVRSSLRPMWNCLSALVDGSAASNSHDLQPLVDALVALRQARACHEPDEAALFIRPLLQTVPEAGPFERLREIPPEARLSLFDKLAGALKDAHGNALLRRNALALTAAYLSTVAAGGAASLALVESDSNRWPELTAWAYLVGGIGEAVTWSSGFDGLGRLVARELQRRLRLDEPPTCDFAFDEALVLWDGELRDPLVHLRIKQARVLSVALFPGVNVSIPIADTAARESAEWEERTKQQSLAEGVPTGAHRQVLLETLAGALWPFLRPLVNEATRQGSLAEDRSKKRSSQRSRNKRKDGAPGQLSLKNSKKST